MIHRVCHVQFIFESLTPGGEIGNNYGFVKNSQTFRHTGSNYYETALDLSVDTPRHPRSNPLGYRTELAYAATEGIGVHSSGVKAFFHLEPENLFKLFFP